MRLSVTIITRDEELRLPAALASVSFADDIVVLDSGSRDATEAIARAAGARWFAEHWRGYGAMKDRAAELAHHDAVLNLDADERLSAALAAAIHAAPPFSAANPAAYALCRRNHVSGRPLRHWPWSGDWQVRLYDRRRARFGSAAVHESLHVDGKVATLPGILDHLTYRDWADCAARQARYAELWAAAAHTAGRRPGSPMAHACAAFLRESVLRGHLLGGIDGLRFAWASARYAAAKHRRLSELRIR